MHFDWFDFAAKETFYVGTLIGITKRKRSEPFSSMDDYETTKND